MDREAAGTIAALFVDEDPAVSEPVSNGHENGPSEDL
jgi:hypothetical protein